MDEAGAGAGSGVGGVVTGVPDIGTSHKTVVRGDGAIFPPTGAVHTAAGCRPMPCRQRVSVHNCLCLHVVACVGCGVAALGRESVSVCTCVCVYVCVTVGSPVDNVTAVSVGTSSLSTAATVC